MKLLRSKTIVLALGCVISALGHAQKHSQQLSVIGTWNLVRIDAGGAVAKLSESQQPTGILMYTADGHAAVQLMYPQTSLSNEFVHDGYEATFGTYDLDQRKHQLVYHVHGSGTREKLVGKTETLHYEFPDDRHMIIRPTQADQHWSVTWERF